MSAMLTDAPPRNANRAGFLESEPIRTLDLPQDGRLLPFAKSIELAMTEGTTAAVRTRLRRFSGFRIRVLQRPILWYPRACIETTASS